MALHVYPGVEARAGVDVSLVLRRVYFHRCDDLGLRLSHWLLHGLADNGGDWVACVLNKALLAEQLVMSRHKNLRVLFQVVGLFGRRVGGARGYLVGAVQFKLLAAVVRQRAIRVAVGEAAVVVAVVAAAWAVVVVSLVLSMGDTDAEVVGVG